MSLSFFPRNAIQPCLPNSAKEPPIGPDWIHEIKHDGFLACRVAKDVRLYIRNDHNLADRFPCIVEVLKACRRAPDFQHYV